MVPLPAIGASVIEEAAIEQRELVLDTGDFVELPQMALDELPDRPRDLVRVTSIDVGPDGTQPPQEVAAVDKDRGAGHAAIRKEKAPRDRPHS